MYIEKQCAIHNTAAKRFESRLIKKYHQAQNIGLRRLPQCCQVLAYVAS
jgi:hypothetical protein